MALGSEVQLLNTIPAVSLCGGKIPLQLQASTNMIDNAGTKAEIVLTWTDEAVADEYFDLTLKGVVTRFTCKFLPDNSGVQFHDNDPGDLLEDWVAIVAADLEKNYLIARYYTVGVAGAAITLTARDAGADLSMVFTAGAGIDCTATANQAGVDKLLKAFYGIVLLVYCNNDFVKELFLNVDTDGQASTDIAELIRPFLKQEFKWPESVSEFMFLRSSAIASFCFLYGERYGAGQYGKLTRSITYYAMDGGVSWMQQAKLNRQESSWWDKLLYNNYFLSWAPLKRIIGPEEPVKLYYLNHTAATSLKLMVKLYTASTDTTITVVTVTPTADKTIYELVLSPAKLAYDGLDDLTLVKFDVWIANQLNVRISEIRTYTLDYDHYEHTRYIIFRNSLGAYECLRSTGLMAGTGSYSRETATVDPGEEYTEMDREDLAVGNSELQKYTLSLGWLNRFGVAEEYRNWLRELALSTEVYLLAGNTLKPIRITGDNLDAGKDRDNSRGFTFEFVNAFMNEHFTKEITWNLENEDYSSDFQEA